MLVFERRWRIGWKQQLQSKGVNMSETNGNSTDNQGGDKAEELAKGIRVFVYGTLKEGHYNHILLSEGKGTRFLGRCYIEGSYRMVDMGSFPGVLQVTPDALDPCRIYGEVYRVDEETLYALDMLEGHPSFYRREKVETPWKKAWMYFLPSNYERTKTVVDTGVWRPSPEESEFVWGKTG